MKKFKSFYVLKTMPYSYSSITQEKIVKRNIGQTFQKKKKVLGGRQAWKNPSPKEKFPEILKQVKTGVITVQHLRQEQSIYDIIYC